MIRIANRNDIDRLVEMEIFVNRYNLKNILPNDFLYNKKAFENKKKWMEKLMDDMDSNQSLEIYVLEDENIIKGYFSIGFDLNNKDECELLQFLIDVPFQNNKFGTLLLDYCIKLLKGRGKKIVKIEEVFEQNIIANKLYEKFGFKMVEKYISKDWNIYSYKYKKIL
jgi:ribosomal protein S18 acetylase RimI-like enzyme